MEQEIKIVIARVVLILSVLSLQLPDALATEWVMDPKNSDLKFVPTYEGLEAPGRFNQFDVRLRFYPESPQNGQLDVSVNLSSADMDSDDINDAIAQKEWLHVTRFPQAHFRSTKIVINGKHAYLAHGMLSLKGIERPIDVPFTWNDAGNRARMQGEFVVKRTNFNIGTGEWSTGNVIGMDVKVGFKVELRRTE